jgi:hypothetical protein
VVGLRSGWFAAIEGRARVRTGLPTAAAGRSPATCSANLPDLVMGQACQMVCARADERGARG